MKSFWALFPFKLAALSHYFQCILKYGIKKTDQDTPDIILGELEPTHDEENEVGISFNSYIHKDDAFTFVGPFLWIIEFLEP